MSEFISDVFGPGGRLAALFGSNYTPRPGQIQMALEVDQNVLEGGALVVEAPTGVGKSLGYLAPYVGQGKKLLVVTSGILLQEQLVSKDLPLLQQALGRPLTFVLLKGISNYLCLSEYEDFAGDAALLGIKDEEIAEQWPVVEQWASETLSGDLAELPFELKPKIRLKVTTNSEDCLGAKCTYRDSCFAREARERARNAQIVVSNAHLFCADLTLKAGDPTAGPLPPYNHVVIDEAHDLPDIARDFFGFRITPGSVRRAARFLRGSTRFGFEGAPDATKILSKLEAASESFFETVVAVARAKEYSGRLEQAGKLEPTRIQAALGEVSRKYGEMVADGVSMEAAAALGGAMERISAINAQLQFAADLFEPTKFVYFVEAEPAAVAMKPISVGPMLRKHFFQREDLKSVVLCSATLSTSAKDDRFEFFSHEIGVESPYELAVGSPFDFGQNALLYLPSGVHDPNTREFPDDVADVCWDVASAAGGRTLCLFTSNRVLRHVHETFVRRGAPWNLLVQGTAPRSQLVERFKADETSVLFGCESFWQGLDVPGPALSAVVIDKIPFPHQEDPVIGAIASFNRNWFTEASLPRAIIATKQGFGRLIRRGSDFGVVALCDPRIRTKGYGKKFTRALPSSMPSVNSIGHVREFFDRRFGSASGH